MLFLSAFVFGFALIVLYIWFDRTSKYHHIPSCKYRLPLLGNFLRLDNDPTIVIKRINTFYFEICKKTLIFWIFFKPFLATMDVKLFESVLKSHQYINKGFSYNLLKVWLGSGLLINGGELWKKRRKLLTPAFHVNMSQNVDIMNKHAQTFVSYLNTHCCKSLIEFSALSKRFTLGLLCEASMGVEHDCIQMEETSDVGLYIRAIDSLTHIACVRFRFPPYMSERIFKWFSPLSKEYGEQLNYAKTFTRNVIENRIKLLEENQCVGRNIFLDILIDAYKRNEIDIEGIIDEVNTFMFEGHDTVSSAISWTIYLLGRDIRVQDKVFKEIESVDVENLQFDDLQKLVYIEYVIKESLRLHPPVPMFIRQIQSDTSLESGLHVPSGTEFIFHVYQLHRDESIWKNANKFYPERFQDRYLELNNPFCYVPFSAGPRNCIGQRFAMMEMKIVVYHLLKRFRFMSVHAEEDLKPVVEVVHRAAHGIRVHVETRSK